MSGMSEFIEWCKKEVQELQAHLKWLESDGVMLRTRSADTGWEDAKPDAIASTKRKIGDLERIIARHPEVE